MKTSTDTCKSAVAVSAALNGSTVVRNVGAQVSFPNVKQGTSAIAHAPTAGGLAADPFHDRNGDKRVVYGVAVNSGSTRLAELAARSGFESVWIDMEHGGIDFQAAEAMCVSIELGGGYPAVRVPDGQRCHVLRALEIGARIVVVPMVAGAAECRQIVEFGKFAPLGQRGFNTRSRGVDYGQGDVKAIFRDANARTHLFAQIETLAAVEQLDEMCQVDGLAGIFIGPGDLSISGGWPGELNHPDLIHLVADCVRRAVARGKHVGILVAPGPLLDAALEAGCNLVFCGGDITELSKAWPALRRQFNTAAR